MTAPLSLTDRLQLYFEERGHTPLGAADMAAALVMGIFLATLHPEWAMATRRALEGETQYWEQRIAIALMPAITEAFIASFPMEERDQ